MILLYMLRGDLWAKYMDLNKFIYPESDKNVVDDFYREIWHENEYDRYFKINHGDKVIDCGAFIGMFSSSGTPIRFNAPRLPS